MNVKQVESLTGIAQQNIRFYERQGLLRPSRNAENNYRDFSSQDVRTLKVIKLLRKLKMPVEQIAAVLEGRIPLSSAMEEQLRTLEEEQQQLSAAIAFCQELGEEQLETLDVDEKLSQIERREKEGSVFGNIARDFMAVMHAEDAKGFSFTPESMVLDSPREFTQELFSYADENNLNLVITKESMYPEFTIDGVEYTAERHFSRYGAVVTCRLVHPEEVEPKHVSKSRLRFFMVLRRLIFPVALFLFLFLPRLYTVHDLESFLSVFGFAFITALVAALMLRFWLPNVKP